MATPESQARRQILVLRLLRHVRSIAARTCEINKPDVEHGNRRRGTLYSKSPGIGNCWY